MPTTYRVFKRSATSFEEFASARKYEVGRGLAREEAQRMCEEWNRRRTPAQIRRGTKLEFEKE